MTLSREDEETIARTKCPVCDAQGKREPCMTRTGTRAKVDHSARALAIAAALDDARSRRERATRDAIAQADEFRSHEMAMRVIAEQVDKRERPVTWWWPVGTLSAVGYLAEPDPTMRDLTHGGDGRPHGGYVLRRSACATPNGLAWLGCTAMLYATARRDAFDAAPCGSGVGGFPHWLEVARAMVDVGPEADRDDWRAIVARFDQADAHERMTDRKARP